MTLIIFQLNSAPILYPQSMLNFNNYFFGFDIIFVIKENFFSIRLLKIHTFTIYLIEYNMWYKNNLKIIEQKYI
jgi:hypothetical protein